MKMGGYSAQFVQIFLITLLLTTVLCHEVSPKRNGDEKEKECKGFLEKLTQISSKFQKDIGQVKCEDILSQITNVISKIKDCTNSDDDNMRGASFAHDLFG